MRSGTAALFYAKVVASHSRNESVREHTIKDGLLPRVRWSKSIPRLINNKTGRNAMQSQNVLHTQTGSGILVLKSRKSGYVIWTLDFFDNGEVGDGQIWGNRSLIRLAAQDKLAKLVVSPSSAVDVAVNDYRASKASVRGLLISQDYHLGAAVPG